MRIVIVGGGNVGYYLVKTLMAEKHRIMLIDSNRARCERVENAFGGAYVEVTHGDGTSVDCLRDAGIYHAEAFIAVTGQDQNNLVSCQLAKDFFGVKRTIARVKNPKNIRVFEQLGVDSVISSTARIAGSIDQELDWADVNSLLTQKATHVRVREALVVPGSPYNGKRLGEIGLPKGMIVVCIVRDGEALVPDGETRLAADDNVVILGNEADLPRVISAVRGEEI
ncbi:MAG: NAD-binding protein [Eubacteriales bacterium]|nr:NAD-binding protein [Eubacteriales bacterium]